MEDFWSLHTTSLNFIISGTLRYIGALGARVICDNIPGLVNKQRQLCQRHPDIMQAIGEGTKEWIRECQHQFRHHRWNCSTLDRDHTVFGRVLLRSKSLSVKKKKLLGEPEAVSPSRSFFDLICSPFFCILLHSAGYAKSAWWHLHEMAVLTTISVVSTVHVQQEGNEFESQLIPFCLVLEYFSSAHSVLFSSPSHSTNTQS